MKLSIIEDLLKAKPKKRGKLLEEMHARNLAYFQKNAPSALVNQLAQLGSGRFELRINEEFLDILDRRAGGAYCHPPGRLLDYVRDFGSWHHTGWIDRLSVTHAYIGNDEHSQLRQQSISYIYEHVPEVLKNWERKTVVLPKTKDGRRYSGTCIFLGIYSGLHIVQYLNTTVVKDVIFIEPDMECLALSCFFVDYAMLHRRFGKVVLHAGDKFPEDPINYLISTASVTSGVWLRLLPAYPFGAFDEITRRVFIRWNSLHEIRVPFDRELRNLGYGAKNLRSGFPVLASRPSLSENSRIVVVGSGPSLEGDLAWLEENQSRLIIVCAHSAARILRKAGIKPDFQCTLDTEIEDELLKKLDMFPDVPLFAYYKANPEMFAGFKSVLLFHEENKANVVDFLDKVTFTHPTSGNTAVALAVHFRPSVIYLAGMDLGFRDASRSHAAGTWHDDEGGAGHGATQAADVLPAEANFQKSEGEIYTYSYLNNARVSIEAALQTVVGNTRIVNLSDGIKVGFATAAHSADEQPTPYPDKEADLEAIHGAFSTGASQVWKAYSRSAAEALDSFRRDLKARVTMTSFDWLAFANAIDSSWNVVAVKNINEGGGDYRIEAFGKLISDLLMDWYRALCHTMTPSQAKEVYRNGLAAFSAALDSLKFPPELDAFNEPANQASGNE